MLMYGYVAKWKKRGTVWFALFSFAGAFIAPLVVNEPIGKIPAFFVFLMLAFMSMSISVSPDTMEEVRPVPESFYKPLGSFDATVRNVAPHVVEVETDSGAVLFADADRVPEVACFRGARVEVDASVVTSPAGQGDVRADGVGGFVDARECKCTAGYDADVAMGDESRSKWDGKARFYAVTAVRATD